VRRRRRERLRALQPQYRTAPAAARWDADVHEMLASIEARREGGVCERELGMRDLRLRLAPTTSGDDG
jgi:hypothetical protein